MGQSPKVLVAFGKRRKGLEKGPSGTFLRGNPRRGFLGRAHGPQRASTIQPETRPKRPPPFGGSGGGVSKLGGTETAPGAICFAACAPFAAFLPPAAPVQAVELCSTPRKLLKKFDQNFYAPSAITFSPCVSVIFTRTNSPAKFFPLANNTGV